MFKSGDARTVASFFCLVTELELKSKVMLLFSLFTAESGPSESEYKEDWSSILDLDEGVRKSRLKIGGEDSRVNTDSLHFFKIMSH